MCFSRNEKNILTRAPILSLKINSKFKKKKKKILKNIALKKIILF